LDTLHLRKALPVEDELELDSIDIGTMNKIARNLPLSVIRRLDSVRGRLLHLSG